MTSLSDFHHQIYGPEDGRRWVFVHGLMGFAANWRKIIGALEGTERCLSYDQRGHGRSIKPAHGYRPQDYGDDLLHILDDLGWEKIILVGHSMGGRNVYHFASRFPDRVEKLVVEDIGVTIHADNLKYYEDLLGSIPTPFATREAAKQFLLHDFVEQSKNRTRDKAEILGQYFYANMEQKPDGTTSWRFSKEGILETVNVAHEKDYWAEWKSLSMPTLLIRGENSKELSREEFQSMLDANKMIKGVEIADAGHWVHSDQPAAFIEALKDFAQVP